MIKLYLLVDWKPFLGGNAAIEGEQLGVIVGTRIERNDAGQFVVNASGNYKYRRQYVYRC